MALLTLAFQATPPVGAVTGRRFAVHGSLGKIVAEIAEGHLAPQSIAAHGALGKVVASIVEAHLAPQAIAAQGVLQHIRGDANVLGEPVAAINGVLGKLTGAANITDGSPGGDLTFGGAPLTFGGLSVEFAA